jgi:hypothetical protein
MASKESHPGVNPWPATTSNGTATQSESTSFVSSPHPSLNRFLLPNGEFVSCVYWNGLYQITGTDIGEVHVRFSPSLAAHR